MRNPVLRGLTAAFSMVLLCLAVWWFWTKGNDPSQLGEAPTVELDRLEKQGLPEIRLPKLDGSEFVLAAIKDQMILINFWASWCDPCVKEFPSMLELTKKMNGKLRFVAISADESKEPIKKFLKAFGGAHHPNVDILWDPDYRIAGLMGTKKLPESYILDKSHRLVRKVIGLENWATDDVIEFFKDVEQGKER